MDTNINAGSFGEWLAAMRAVLRGERSADVPCGDCIGCCISSYPIPLRPGDELARQQVPEQWLIGAAGPGRDWLMGFREDGSCPFLDQCRCSIYAGRPETCRDYDCRIYAAAGLTPDGNRRAIAERIKAWEFSFDSDHDRTCAAAVKRAADFISARAALFPAAMRAGSATAVAVLAVKTHELFLDDAAMPSVQGVVEAAKAFDCRP